MVLNLLPSSSRLHEPFHTGAVVKLLGATAGAGTTTCGLTPGGSGVGVVVAVGRGVVVVVGDDRHAVLYLKSQHHFMIKK